MAQATRHYGFAQVPRDVTRGKYKKASLVEKGLYVCLKDICGDEGECFYTLRNLAKEVNTSISTLSRYIPKMVELGLITADKKPGRSNNHEIFHITIVNIWQENDARYKPQEIVSDRNNLEETVSNRNNRNNSVSDRNNSVSDRNRNLGGQAQDCFNLNARIRVVEEDSSEEERIGKPAATSPSYPLTEIELSFWQLWLASSVNKDSLRQINVTESAYNHIKRLAPLNFTAEQLESLIAFSQARLNASDKKNKHVYLGNLVGDYGDWKQSQKEPTPFPTNGVKPSPVPGYKSAKEINKKGDRFLPTQEMRA